MSTIRTQAKLATVDQIQCNGCGNSLSVMNPRAKYISCQYCGSVLDLNSEDYQILETIGKPEKYQPFSFLELGMTGTINGKTYQLISRTRWRQKYKEYWYEEGSSGYSSEVWVYDEWLMMNENNTYFYLVEDKTGYWVSEEIVPETPMLLESDLQMQFFRSQPMRRVQEYGTAEVIFFEGESNYTIIKGDTIRFATYKDRGINYMAEWRMQDENEIREIEFFKEIPVSRRKVIEWFGSNEQVTVLKEDESFWKFVYQASLLGAVLMLILGIASLTIKGEAIFEKNISFSEIMSEEGLLVGPFDISEKGLYRMDMNISGLVQNSEIYILGYIMDADQAVINKIDGTFGYYTGYDDEGKWTEKSLKEKSRFRVEQPGKYYVQFHSETARQPSGELTFYLRKGGLVGRYFLIGLIVFGVVATFAKTRYER